MAETQVGTLRVDLVANFDNFKRGLARAADNLNRSKLVFAAASVGIGAIGAAAVKTAGQMEQWRISFTTMLGSADRADALLHKIKDFAKETPFDLPQVVKGSKSLLAFGIEAGKLLPTMKSLGDVSAGLGVPMERLILNFGQVKSQAKLTGRELRDFAIAGVPLVAELAKNLNVAESEISEMVSAGKIGFKEVEEAFKTMSSEGGRFNNLMQSQMKSLFGRFSNLGDAVIQLGIAFGNILLPPIKEIVKTVTTWIEKFTVLPTSTKVLIVAVAGLAAAFSGLLAVMGSIVALWPTISAFFATLLGPMGLIAASITSIIALTVAWKTNFLGFRDVAIEIMNSLGSAFSELFQKLDTIYDGALSEWFSDLKTVASASIDFIRDSVKWLADKMKAWLEDLQVVIGFFSEESASKLESTIKEISAFGSEALDIAKDGVVELKNNAIEKFDKIKKKTIELGETVKAKSQEVTDAITMDYKKQFNAAKTAYEKQMSFSQQLRLQMMKDLKSWSNIFVSTVTKIRDAFASGMADMIVEGGNFKEKMEEIGKNILKFFIEQVIKKMITQWILGMGVMGRYGPGMGGMGMPMMGGVPGAGGTAGVAGARGAAGGAGSGIMAGLGTVAGIAGGAYAGQVIGKSMFGQSHDIRGVSRGTKAGSLVGAGIGTMMFGPLGGLAGGVLGGAVGGTIGKLTGGKTQHHTPLERVVMDVNHHLNRIGANAGSVFWRQSGLELTNPQFRTMLNKFIVAKQQEVPGLGTHDAPNKTKEIITEFLTWLSRSSRVKKKALEPLQKLAGGGIIKEPALFRTLKSGVMGMIGESGPEAVIPFKQSSFAMAGAGGGPNININIQGSFLEAEPAKWQRLFREHLMPEIRRYTDSNPKGPMARRRGQRE